MRPANFFAVAVAHGQVHGFRGATFLPICMQKLDKFQRALSSGLIHDLTEPKLSSMMFIYPLDQRYTSAAACSKHNAFMRELSVTRMKLLDNVKLVVDHSKLKSLIQGVFVRDTGRFPLRGKPPFLATCKYICRNCLEGHTSQGQGSHSWGPLGRYLDRHHSRTSALVTLSIAIRKRAFRSDSLTPGDSLAINGSRSSALCSALKVLSSVQSLESGELTVCRTRGDDASPGS